MQRLVAGDAPSVSFDTFAATEGERLRRALVARYGVDVGNDVCADALAYAWEHWERVEAMDNRVGYLYRVAQSASRRHRRWRVQPRFPAETAPTPRHDPDLGAALAKLGAVPRQCVVLVHIYGWSYDEVATALGVTPASVRNHIYRGLTKLRNLLEPR